MERSLGVVTASTTDTIQTTAQNAQSALIAATNEVSYQGQIDLGRYRALGARRQQQFRLDDDRQDRRNRHLRSAADRPSGADRRQPPRFAGRGAQHQDHATRRPTSTASPPTRLKSIETRGQSVLAIDVDPWFGSRAQRSRPAGDLATGAVAKSLKDLEAVVAFGHRPVASGLDRRRHRNAGDQQDPAHRYGGAVRTAA